VERERFLEVTVALGKAGLPERQGDDHARTHDLGPSPRQAEVLRISRGKRVPTWPRPVSATDLEIMRHLDRLHLEFPSPGSRMPCDGPAGCRGWLQGRPAVT